MSIECNSLLSKRIIDKYDYGKSKEEVIKIITNLEEARYKYGNLVFPSISSNFEIKFNSNISYTNDKVSNYVERKLDGLEYINETNQKLSEVSCTFTKEESQYFINYFLYKKSEDFICEEMIISKNSLIPIKESCVIKIALMFDKAIIKNNKGGDAFESK